MKIQRIEPVSCAKIAGIIYAAIGLLIGALVSLFALVGLAFSSAQQGWAENPMSPLIGMVMGVGAIIAFPIFYGALGFFFALLGAWVYNLVASRVGGIEIEVA